MIDLKQLAIELAKLGLRKTQKAIAEFKIAASEVQALSFTKDAKGMYVTQVEDFNIKCNADVRVAIATSTTVTVSIYSFENDKKEVITYARFTAVE